MTTKTLVAYHARRQEQKRLDAEFVAIAEAEFPIGTAVRWVHTYKQEGGMDVPKYLDGLVTRHSGYPGSSRFEIRRKTGVTYDIEAHRLELVTSTAAQTQGGGS